MTKVLCRHIVYIITQMQSSMYSSQWHPCMLISGRAIGEYSNKRSVLNAGLTVPPPPPPGWSRGSYSSTFNMSHCANV